MRNYFHCLNTFFKIFCSILLFYSNFVLGQSMNGNLNDYLKVKSSTDSVRIKYEEVSGHDCPSLSILIHTPNDIIFASSTAMDEPTLTKDTYFRFASNTKNFTSASVLKMQEDGWLNIKNKLIDTIPGSKITYLPDDPDFEIPYLREITIEQLLQHSAGVYDVDNDTVPGCNGNSYTDYMTYKDPAHQFELAELIRQNAINQLSYFPPGKGYHYSNTGYTVLSLIIERVYSFRVNNKKVYADYINDFITGRTTKVPLDIYFPYLANDISLKTPFIKGTIYTKDSTTVYNQVNMSAHVGEGNGYATFTDLDNYIRSMLKGENILSPGSIELMKNTVSDSNKTYALGCFFIEDLGYGHNGCIKGYLSNMLYDPVTDVSLIIMMPVNDYSHPDEEGIVYGLKALANAGFSARMKLGFPGRKLDY